MRVCMLLWNHFPHDVRIEKEARALAAGGHEVTLVCLSRDDEPPRETVGGVDVVRIDPWRDYSTPQRVGASLAYNLMFVHPMWRDALAGAARDVGADALHVHDLPLAKTAIDLGEELDVPVVVDLHENYPEAIRQWRKGMSRWDRWEGRLTNPVWLLKRRERYCVRHADATLCITPAGKRHYVEDCGADPGDVTVVTNAVDLDAFDGEADPVEGFEDAFVLGYVGSFGPHRGLETAIDAMPTLLGRAPEAHLLLVGAAGEDAYDEALRERVAERGVGDSVTFTGWVDLDRVPNYIAACDLPFVLHYDNPHTATTVPHKLFQYMAAEKPVLVSDVETLARPVEDADAGVVVRADDPGAVADATARLASDPDEAARLAANGRRAVETEYNWAAEAERLRAVYADL